MNKYKALLILFCIATIACKKNSTTTEHLVQNTVLEIPVVSAIYPESDSIPENVLKFYIRFSQPMREGDFFKHIQLLDSNGTNLNGIFFDNVYELWTSNHKQLTIIVDPGRVKSGLRENEKSGRAFTAGESYTLKINTTWKSIKGINLSETFSKEFTVITEDVIPPNVEDILISEIEKNSKKPIIIQFNEALDVLQLTNYIRIIEDESIINGKLLVLNKGKTIQFTPDENWQQKAYQLQIDKRLEDIAANNFSGKFDSPKIESTKYHSTGKIYKTIILK